MKRTTVVLLSALLLGFGYLLTAAYAQIPPAGIQAGGTVAYGGKVKQYLSMDMIWFRFVRSIGDVLQ